MDFWATQGGRDDEIHAKRLVRALAKLRVPVGFDFAEWDLHKWM